jgi:hypothetical protein
MKKIILSFLLFLFALGVRAQDTIKLKDLAVPNSPAFILTDATFSLVQSPNTPKAFVLGIGQSFQSSGGFPQEYSAEFTPFWWFNPVKKDVYALAGLRTQRTADNKITSVAGENPFSGLKFTSLSLALLNKDMIPDTFTVSQKIVSLGMRSTIIRIHMGEYARTLNEKLKAWHTAAIDESDIGLQTDLARAATESERTAIKNKFFAKVKEAAARKIADEINELIQQKPIFSWDIATAFASYGINDSLWQTGRSGIWTTVSSYIPLALNTANPGRHYLNLNLAMRYLVDHFQKDEKAAISQQRNFDIGFKIGLELDKLSIGVESLYRKINGAASSQNRTLGFISFKISDTIFLNGAFGKNFDAPNKLVSQLGISWGLGSEKALLPAL